MCLLASRTDLELVMNSHLISSHLAQGNRTAVDFPVDLPDQVKGDLQRVKGDLVDLHRFKGREHTPLKRPEYNTHSKRFSFCTNLILNV